MTTLPPGKDRPAHLSPDPAQPLDVHLGRVGRSVIVYTLWLAGVIKWLGLAFLTHNMRIRKEGGHRTGRQREIDRNPVTD
jgi:hypothetical protein